jgi:hypothetical protein
MAITDHEHPIDPAQVAHARPRLPTAEESARLTGLLSTMSDPVRLRRIYALDVTEELCLGDLVLTLDVSEDSVSYALRLLRTAGNGRRLGTGPPPEWAGRASVSSILEKPEQRFLLKKDSRLSQCRVRSC